MIWVDQTLDEGLRIAMDAAKLQSIVEMLQSLQIKIIDVSVNEWNRYRFSPSMVEPLQLRGKINAKVEDVELAAELGFTHIVMSCSRNAEEGLTTEYYLALAVAQKRNMKISLCIENASECSTQEIEGLWRDMSIAGVTTLIYSDGGSLLNPLSTFNSLLAVVKNIPVDIEFHAHNAHGLATANALGAIKAGVTAVATSVAGIGLQGHTALEEIMMIQKCLLSQDVSGTQQLASLCACILSEIGIAVPGTKAIIGQDIFAHESGIHVDGVLKNPKIYEAFSPEEVGLSRQLVLGKHSGTASIQSRFKEWGIALSAEDAQLLLKQVRCIAVQQRQAVSDDTLWQLYQRRVVQGERVDGYEQGKDNRTCRYNAKGWRTVPRHCFFGSR